MKQYQVFLTIFKVIQQFEQDHAFAELFCFHFYFDFFFFIQRSQNELSLVKNSQKLSLKHIPNITFKNLVQGTPDPRISTFKPLKQRVDTDIMYVGIGFLPDDWYYYHSKVSIIFSGYLIFYTIKYQGRMSDRAYKSIRILDTLRWTGPTDPPKQSSTAAKQIYQEQKILLENDKTFYDFNKKVC